MIKKTFLKERKKLSNQKMLIKINLKKNNVWKNISKSKKQMRNSFRILNKSKKIYKNSNNNNK